jgi:serine/threonine-protein kinase
MYCPECGASLQPEDPYCGECGARQEAAAPVPVPVVVEARRPGTGASRDEGRMADSKKPTSAPSAQLEPDTLLLDRYIIVRRVGGGGMGSVYQAKDKRLADRLCAVKEMIELFADETQRMKAVEDFKREAEVLAQLEHPSIPTIYDYFIEGGRYYLVMKWIGGGDLAEQMRLRGGIVDEVAVTRWAIQICDVLHYIHSQKPPIIYRDLKPANLMLDDRTTRVMLVDFGIARIVRPTEKGVTAIGTMGYAPPELFAGKVEPRSDIYSLGATMFHMMTGSDPQDNPLLIFDFTKNSRPTEINPAITPAMERILERAVAYKPEDRHGSALEMMRVLEEHQSRLQAESRSGRPMGSAAPVWGVPVEPAPRPAPANAPPSSGSGLGIPAASAPVGRPGTEQAIDWVYCGHCGQKIAFDDVYCPHCGFRQPIGGMAGQGSGSGPRVTAQLVVVGTVDMVKPFRIDKDSILIGRMDPHTGIFPEVDLTKHDPQIKVSRRHARIYRQGEQFFIEDLASVNGTVVNSINGGSVRLNPKSPRVLAVGDELKLGETTLKFMIA